LGFSLIIEREVSGKKRPKRPKGRLRYYQTIAYGKKENAPKTPHWGIWGISRFFEGDIRIFSLENPYTPESVQVVQLVQVVPLTTF